jgi:WD40 repeat protein
MRAALLPAAAAVLALTACGSSHRTVWSHYPSVPEAASRVSHDCARKDDPSSDVDSLLWLRGGKRPLVYYRADVLPGHHVLSSPGGDYPLWGVFWPCNPPVIVYGRPRSPLTFVTVLAPGHGQLKTTRVGRFRLAGGSSRTSLAGYGNAIIGANGRLIFFDGATIRYADGDEFAARDLPRGWRITRLAVSPWDSGTFLASVESKPGPDGCRGTVEGAVYLISPERSTKLRSYDPCADSVGAEWSPNGRKILWFSGADPESVFVSDGQGRHLHEIADDTDGALWSPDGRMIAYAQGKSVFVLDLSSGVRRLVGRGGLGAWSPDGKELALVELRPVGAHGIFEGGSIVAFPVHGNRSRLLLRIPAAK